jgi:hypothetical protein
MVKLASLLKIMATLLSDILSSSSTFVNQIKYFVASTSTIYSTSHVEVATDVCFLDCQPIFELLSQESLPEMVCGGPDNFQGQSLSTLPE